MAKSLAVQDICDCPYCGRPGVVAEIFKDDSYFIVHKVVRKQIRSEATGAMIETMVFTDGCRRGVRCGENYATNPDGGTQSQMDNAPLAGIGSASAFTLSSIQA